MQRLTPPAWAEGFSVSSSQEKQESTQASISSSSSSAGSSSLVSPSASLTSPASPLISELVTSLTNRRLHREVNLALRSSLEDARADFSFRRLRGLKTLLRFLASVSTSEALISIFQDSQTDRSLQVVPVLFQHSLAPSTRNPPVFSGGPLSFEEPEQVTSPPTDYEVALALRLLEGCCLLDKGSRMIASQHMAIKEVIELISAGGLLEQGACLDALPALMLDMPINQQEFLGHHGVQKILELVKHGHVEESMRWTCGIATSSIFNNPSSTWVWKTLKGAGYKMVLHLHMLGSSREQRILSYDDNFGCHSSGKAQLCRLKGAEFLLLLVGDLLSHNDHEVPSSTDVVVAELHEQLGNAFFSVLEQVGPPSSDAKGREHALHWQAKQLLELLDSGSW